MLEIRDLFMLLCAAFNQTRDRVDKQLIVLPEETLIKIVELRLILRICEINKVTIANRNRGCGNGSAVISNFHHGLKNKELSQLT